MEFRYFTTEYAIITQNKIIEISGGLPGIKNIGDLVSPLEHIQNDFYYPTFEEKATHLFFSINKNHSFNDGNKRSSIALAAFFLEINGYDYIVNSFIRKMENIAVYVADNKIDKELLQKIITSVINEDDYSEELKLKIIYSLEK